MLGNGDDDTVNVTRVEGDAKVEAEVLATGVTEPPGAEPEGKTLADSDKVGRELDDASEGVRTADRDTGNV